MGAYICSACNKGRSSGSHGYNVCVRCEDEFCDNCAQNEEELCEGCHMDLQAKASEMMQG